MRVVVLYNILGMNYIKTSKYFTYISALLAFILWGGWAYYVNDEFGSKSRILSSITQGTFSFIITLLMTKLIAYQYNIYPGKLFKIIFPPVITVSATGTLLVLIHIKVGTNSIFKTVYPALTVSLIFGFFTVYKLHLESAKIKKEYNCNGEK